jgi:hypothetical protein
MTDTTDNQILYNSYTNSGFQDRCRLRFLNAALAAENEVAALTTNAVTPAGAVLGTNNVLHFAATTGITVGMTASDLFASAVVPAGSIVTAVTATSVTLNNFVTGAGVGSADTINFAPVGHVQRMAFAGALEAGTVDLQMLAMVVLANTTNRTNCLANPSVAGGNILDSDIDFQVNSILTGIAMSRSW